jgi:NCAIR mutase (PurE)-related protein
MEIAIGIGILILFVAVKIRAKKKEQQWQLEQQRQILEGFSKAIKDNLNSMTQNVQNALEACLQTNKTILLERLEKELGGVISQKRVQKE